MMNGDGDKENNERIMTIVKVRTIIDWLRW